MSSYLKRWRHAPRAGGTASQGDEWEELGREVSDADAEDADAVVVGGGGAAVAPPAVAEAPP